MRTPIAAAPMPSFANSMGQGCQNMRIIKTDDVKVTKMEHSQLRAGRQFYNRVVVINNPDANRVIMLNLFNQDCYGALQTCATSYYYSHGMTLLGMDASNKGRWDLMDFDILWEQLMIDYPSPKVNAINHDTTMLSRLLEPMPFLLIDSTVVAKVSDAYAKAQTDLNWKDWDYQGDDPKSWIPNPMGITVIDSYFLNLECNSPYAKEIVKDYVMNGADLDKGPCVTISHMIARLKSYVVLNAKWITNLGILGYTIIPPVPHHAHETGSQGQQGQPSYKSSQSHEKEKDNKHGNKGPPKDDPVKYKNILCAACGKPGHASSFCKSKDHPDANLGNTTWALSPKGIALAKKGETSLPYCKTLDGKTFQRSWVKDKCMFLYEESTCDFCNMIISEVSKKDICLAMKVANNNKSIFICTLIDSGA